MKITRIPVFTCEFGRLEFYPTLAPLGHKIFWTPAGGGERYQVHWKSDDQGITPKLARFYIRVAVAMDRDLPRYHFADQNIDPPNE